MNQTTPPDSENFQELADEIQEFIDQKREPDQIIKAQVTKISSENIIALKLSENFNFYKGALVVLDGISGTVQDKYSDVIKISCKDDHDFQVGENVNIDSSRMNLIIDRLEKTIIRIKENNLDENNIKTLQYILGYSEPHYNQKNVYFKSQTLNIPQKTAIKRTLSADDFHLIIGPPGTGKTYVITEIIKQLLSKRQKILVTAWTNVAVDNILEKFQDISPETVLRLGSFKEINPTCHKFTFENRRKKSPDWDELKQLEELIKKQNRSLLTLENEKKIIKNEIRDLQNKKESNIETIDSIMNIKEQYRIKSLKYKPSNTKVNDILVNLESEYSKLSKESEKYSDLASNLLNLQIWEDSLPDGEVFYTLEEEIKEAHSQKLFKKLTSPFKRKEYQKYLEYIQNKEKQYQKIKELYNNYWEERNRIDEDYTNFYGKDMGNPYIDSLKREIKLLNLHEQYLPIKITAFHNGKYINHNIIHESYQHYISSLIDRADIVKEESALLDVNINLKNRRYDNIVKEIKNLREQMKINQENKIKIMAYIDHEIINNTRLFVSTIISAAHPILKEEFFDWVVMDEASQVASYMSLIPLLKTKRFVLVGDNKQLQPIEESQLSDHLNLSIFNRLLKNFPNSSTFLDTQYRMHEDIANVASKLFYEGNLKTFPNISQQTLDCNSNGDDHELLNPKVPITYIDTSNLEYFEDGVGSSCENSKEADLVVMLVNMLHMEGISYNEIGIITPYRRHKINIQNQLEETQGVDVDTVYRFQGREKDVIILSFCNSKLGRLKPFLRKFIERPSQVNVALTRARKKLILVGNSKTLKESKLLWKLINLIGKENTIKCTDELLIKLNNSFE
jgi:superfamily I DNA and/or RNA helicase